MASSELLSYSMTIMPRARKVDALLSIRIDARTARTLAREARRRRSTRSEIARSILTAGLQQVASGRLESEARRQSLLASRHPSEKDALDFVGKVADTAGWR